MAIDPPSSSPSVHTFHFSYRRRLKTALYPLVLAGVLLLVHWRWVRLGSWVSVALLATVVLLAVRAAQWLWGGRAPVRIDELAISRGGLRVPLKGSEVHLRARHQGKDALRFDEAVVFTPADRHGQRLGVSFDVSLIGFEQALQLLLARVADARVKVWAPGGKQVEAEPREQLLSAFRSPLAQALASAGRGTLAPPRLEKE